ncbi:MAG: hypothetical protein ACP5N2_07395 [Candidatus Nanoarchaeia archaeon]
MKKILLVTAFIACFLLAGCVSQGKYSATAQQVDDLTMQTTDLTSDLSLKQTELTNKESELELKNKYIEFMTLHLALMDQWMSTKEAYRNAYFEDYTFGVEYMLRSGETSNDGAKMEAYYSKRSDMIKNIDLIIVKLDELILIAPESGPEGFEYLSKDEFINTKTGMEMLKQDIMANPKNLFER